jgi:hypothetical protein
MTTGSAQDVKSGFCHMLFMLQFDMHSIQIQKEIISDLNRVFVKRDMGVYMIDLEREICKPILRGMA